MITPALAARELLRRELAAESLCRYAQAIEIPGAPVSEDPDEALFRPIESSIARHHVVIMEAIQRTMERPAGRLMIFSAPGSAKSTYASVVAPTWAMGRWPGHRIILTSYASGIARKQSRRARQICASERYQGIWEPHAALRKDTTAAEDWALDNGSEYMAAGLTAGLTGNRAHGLIVDDACSGREDADSQTMREKTEAAYRDDALTRLIPGGWQILITTRWHESDLAGGILPEDYDGRSGPIACRDGQVWEVLNIPAKCERPDDPLGREIGEYLWPEWFPLSHWAQFEDNPLASRTWSALYQQRPVPQGGGDFTREMFQWYEPHELPGRLRYFGASDFAVKEDALADFTEHGVFGMDADGDLWAVAWWSGQKETDVTIEALLSLAASWRVAEWWNEGGVIDKAMRPALRQAMRERQQFVAIEALTSMADKRAKVQSFRARASARTIHLPKNTAWATRLVDQLIGFPAARYDDMVDVCGLIGRGIDRMVELPGEQMIAHHRIDQAVAREIELHAMPPGTPKLMSIIEGTIVRRHGPKLLPAIDRNPATDTILLVGFVAQQLRDWRPDICFVNAHGAGLALYNGLVQLGFDQVVPVYWGDRQLTAEPRTYYNPRIECWERMKAWLQSADLPDHAELRQELSWPKVRRDINQRLILDDARDLAKRGLPEPRVAEALAQSFAQAVPLTTEAFSSEELEPEIE